MLAFAGAPGARGYGLTAVDRRGARRSVEGRDAAADRPADRGRAAVAWRRPGS
ncbi:hypothetical protein ACU4GR_31710 [Methylobacterium oryzae CBMB20]